MITNTTSGVKHGRYSRSRSMLDLADYSFITSDTERNNPYENQIFEFEKTGYLPTYLNTTQQRQHQHAICMRKIRNTESLP